MVSKRIESMEERHSNLYQRIETMQERHRLMKYATRYMNTSTNFDTIMRDLDFRLFFHRGEFQSYQEIDYYFKPKHSKDKKND